MPLARIEGSVRQRVGLGRQPDLDLAKLEVVLPRYTLQRPDSSTPERAQYECKGVRPQVRAAELLGLVDHEGVLSPHHRQGGEIFEPAHHNVAVGSDEADSIVRTLIHHRPPFPQLPADPART